MKRKRKTAVEATQDKHDGGFSSALHATLANPPPPYQDRRELRLSERQQVQLVHCIVALRQLDPDDRLDVVAALAKTLTEPRLEAMFYSNTKERP
jgi:hypothetical protein